MVVYQHTCIFKALQKDLPMQPPLISLEESFLLTYPFVIWVCAH